MKSDIGQEARKTAGKDVFDDYDRKVRDVIESFGGDLQDLYEHKLGIFRRLLDSGEFPGEILDYGCGQGHLSALLARMYPDREILAYDRSAGSIELARESYGDIPNLRFVMEMPRSGKSGLALAVNVFHHIEPGDRPRELGALAQCLRPGGGVAVIEHNPYNPVTQWIVRNCELDRGVSLIRAKEFRALAAACGLECVQREYILFFPSILKKIRALERPFRFLPAGAQYFLVLKKRSHAI